MPSLPQPALRCPCGAGRFDRVFAYDAPPAGERRFAASVAGPYRRELTRCEVCGHFLSVHRMDLSALYAGDYVGGTYRDQAGIRAAFERIVALDPSESDNAGRAARVLEFAGARPGGSDGSPVPSTLLDVGSGLGVFPHAMKAAGWQCTALDRDPRLVKHLADIVGVEAVLSDFMAFDDARRFDLVSFNKVLEHVPDPVAMLAKSRDHLRGNGFVYLELPDGEAAVREGPEREEFFIEHLHVFSAASAALLAARAGFALRSLERLQEPSSKYTLRALLSAGAERGGGS
ncbi:MAG: class I SAM-dependent methyltransferase [Kiritimatiellae bacterium]|nr:class I SAM-dependent methyltransferase [Kiritimatiellia bacterium]